MTIEKRGYIIKFDYTEALLLQKKYGWQSSLQRTSLQEDTPPGGYASRRTRLQGTLLQLMVR